MQHGDPDIELLSDLGMIKFAAIDAGETYYRINEVVLQLW